LEKASVKQFCIVGHIVTYIWAVILKYSAVYLVNIYVVQQFKVKFLKYYLWKYVSSK